MRQRLEATGVDQRVAGGLGTGGKARRRVGEGVAVGVVRAEQPDRSCWSRSCSTCRRTTPTSCSAPRRSGRSSRTRRPGRRHDRRSTAATAPACDRHGTPLASHWSATRVDHLRCGDGEHQVDTVVEDQLAGLRMRAVSEFGLDVFCDDLDRVRLVAEHDAVGDQVLMPPRMNGLASPNPASGAGERSGETDLDGAVAATAAELGGVGPAAPAPWYLPSCRRWCQAGRSLGRGSAGVVSPPVVSPGVVSAAPPSSSSPPQAARNAAAAAELPKASRRRRLIGHSFGHFSLDSLIGSPSVIDGSIDVTGVAQVFAMSIFARRRLF